MLGVVLSVYEYWLCDEFVFLIEVFGVVFDVVGVGLD